MPVAFAAQRRAAVASTRGDHWLDSTSSAHMSIKAYAVNGRDCVTGGRVTPAAAAATNAPTAAPWGAPAA